MIRRPLLGFASLLLLCSCGPPSLQSGFELANPETRSVAINRAVNTHNFRAVPKIVEQLDADDSVIRMLAINALYRLTGETYGYHHYDPPQDRHAAIQQWVNAVKSGSVPRSAETVSADDLREIP